MNTPAGVEVSKHPYVGEEVFLFVENLKGLKIGLERVEIARSEGAHDNLQEGREFAQVACGQEGVRRGATSHLLGLGSHHGLGEEELPLVENDAPHQIIERRSNHSPSLGLFSRKK